MGEMHSTDVQEDVGAEKEGTGGDEMSTNVKKGDENWTLFVRHDQADFIVSAMMYVIKHCDERVRLGVGIDKFTAIEVRKQAKEIADHISNVTG